MSACQALCRSKHNPGKRGPTVVTKRYRALGATDYDVCVAGGTLGVFLALALQVGFLQPRRCLPILQCVAGCAIMRLSHQGDAKLADL